MYARRQNNHVKRLHLPQDEFQVPVLDELPIVCPGPNGIG